MSIHRTPMKIVLPHNGWRPRPYQQGAWNAFMNDDIKTIVLAWARRHGKDDVGMHATAVKAMKRKGNFYHCLPEYGQARKAIWEAVNPHTGNVRWKDVFPPEIIQHVDQQAMKITFKNGSTWQLVGSDNPDSLMGTTPVGVVFSEAALANPATYAFFRPILMENNGWSAHISSTRGKNHFHSLYQHTLTDPQGYASHLSAHDTNVFSALQLAAERAFYIKQYGHSLGTSLFEQEYLSSWDAAIIGAVYGQELKDLEAEGRALPLIYDPRYPVDTSWDLGVGDSTVILFWQTVGNVERLISWYAAQNTGLEHFAEELQERGYLYRDHLGPHDIAVREWGANGVSRMSQAKRLGVRFKAMPKLAKGDSIALSSQLIKRMEINVSDTPVEDPFDDCSEVLEALKQYRFSYDKERKVLSKAPVHDFSSHYADALATKAAWAAAGKGVAQRPFGQELQGVGADQQFNEMRVRQIMHQQHRKTRGAWG